MADIKIKDEEVLRLIGADFDASIDYAEDLSKLRDQDFRTLRGAPYPVDAARKNKGWSTTINPVVANAVNGTLPGLVEIFSDDFFRFKIDNQEFAEDLKDYVRKVWFQLQDGEKKNDSFLFDCLVYQQGGFFKIYYDRKTTMLTEEWERLPVDQVELRLDHGAELVSGNLVEETMDGVAVEYYENVKMVFEQVDYEGPVIEVPSPDEIGYSPEAKSFDSARLSWCRSTRNLDYVKRMVQAGEFRKGSLKQASSASLDYSADETRAERDSRYWLDGLQDSNAESADFLNSEEPKLKPANTFFLYEIYTKMDVDEDGYLENVIIWKSGNIIFGIKENPYGRVPVRRGVPFKIPHQFLQDPFPRFLEDDQKNLTTLDRLAYDAAARTTYGNVITDDDKLLRQMKNRGPNSVFKAERNAFVQDISPKDPGQFILKAKEMQQGDIENKSGITRYNQGLDANSLNKTLGGMELIMSASQQRQKLLARRLGWTFRDVISDIIAILDEWPTPEYSQLLQKHGLQPGTVKVSDIAIDVGVSFQEKFAMAQQLEQLVQFGIGPGLQLGMTPEHIFSILSKKYNLLGIRTEEFLPDADQLRQREVEQQAMAGGVPGQGPVGPAGTGMPQQPGVEAGIERTNQEFAG